MHAPVRNNTDMYKLYNAQRAMHQVKTHALHLNDLRSCWYYVEGSKTLVPGDRINTHLGQKL